MEARKPDVRKNSRIRADLLPNSGAWRRLGAAMTPAGPSELKAPARHVQVGAARVDLATNSVSRGDSDPLRLSPKAAQVLLALLLHGDRPLHREQLIERVWPGQFRTDDVVTKAMQELRRALAQTPEQLVIETIPRVGYWLRLPFAWIDDSRSDVHVATDESPAAAPTDPVQQVVAVADPAAMTETIRPRGHRKLLLALLLIVISTTLVALWFASPKPKGDTPPAAANLASAQVAPRLNAAPLSSDPGDEAYAALAPDGNLIAIAIRGVGEDRYRLRLRDIGSGGERPLLGSGSGDELAPAWSPDGRSLAYFRLSDGACTLELTDVQGLQRRTLTPCVAGMLVPPEFLPDGSGVLLPWLSLPAPQHRGGFAVVDTRSGSLSNFAYGGEPQGFELEARFSPDGRKLLVQQGIAPFAAVHLYALDYRAPQVPSTLGERFNRINGMTWLSDSRHAVIASDNLGVMELWRIDTQTGVMERFGGLPGQFPSAARHQDLLAFSHVDRSSGLLQLAMGASSKSPELLFASNRTESAPAVSADSRQIAFVSDRTGSAQIYLGDPASGAVQAITELKAGRPYELSFSSDGRQLAFSVRLTAGIQVTWVDLGTRKQSRPELGIASAIDLRFGSAAGELLYAAFDADGAPHIYSQQQQEPDSARRLSECVGRAPRSGPDGWIYFFAPGDRALKRTRGAGPDSSCELVSDRVRWVNRNAWVADASGLYAVLTPLDRVERAGLYRLDPSPELLTELPELARRPLGNLELVRRGDQLIAALPVAANADIWLVRGVADAPLAH